MGFFSQQLIRCRTRYCEQDLLYELSTDPVTADHQCCVTVMLHSDIGP